MKFFVVVLALLLASCIPANPLGIPTQARTATATRAAAATGTAQPAAALSPTPDACIVANTDDMVLNVRRGPSTDAEIIGGLVPGQRVQVMKWGENWLLVSTGNTTGYIFSKYCEAK